MALRATVDTTALKEAERVSALLARSGVSALRRPRIPTAGRLISLSEARVAFERQILALERQHRTLARALAD
jgi:hypothetical protein